MRVQWLGAGLLALIGLLAAGFVWFLSLPEPVAERWDPAVALADTREVLPEEDLVGKRIRFATPTVICQSREALEHYLNDVQQGNLEAAQAMVVTPDHQTGDCTEMDASNVFFVEQLHGLIGDGATLYQLSSGDPGRSLWIASRNIRVVR